MAHQVASFRRAFRGTRLESVQRFFFLSCTEKIQVINTFIFMLTRSSENIFNPMRYTGGKCLQMLHVSLLILET